MDRHSNRQTDGQNDEHYVSHGKLCIVGYKKYGLYEKQNTHKWSFFYMIYTFSCCVAKTDFFFDPSKELQRGCDYLVSEKQIIQMTLIFPPLVDQGGLSNQHSLQYFICTVKHNNLAIKKSCSYIMLSPTVDFWVLDQDHSATQ